MKLHAALVKEQGVTFAVVAVKRHVLTSSDRDRIATGFGPAFPGVPIILMAQDSKGVPTYYGQPDIVRFLKNVLFETLPWKEWRAAA